MKSIAISQKINFNAYINYLIVLYAFCLPLSKAAITGTEILLILFWLLEGNFNRKLDQIKENRFLLMLGIFLLYSALSIFWSDEKIFVLDYLRKYWHFLIIPVIYTSLKKEYIKYVFSSFLIGMLISEIVSYGIFFEIWTKEGVPPNDPSPFMDHINYSVYLAFTVFILMHRIIFSNSMKMKIVYGAFMLCSLSNMLVNGGRTGQVAFFASLVIVALINTKHKLRAVFGSVAAGIIIFVSAYNVSPVFHDRMNYTYYDIQNMAQNSDFTNSMSIRVSLWIMGAHVFLENPIVGTGIGDDAKSINKYIDKYNFNYFENYDRHYIDYHNAFIQYAVQLGTIGLLLFLSLFATLSRLKFQTVIYKNLNITFLCLFVLLSMTSFAFHIMASMVLFSLFAGVFSAISRHETRAYIE